MDKQNHLTASFIRSKADIENRTIPATLSTDAPIERGGYKEILVHRQGSVDMTRFPLPLITNHDTKKLNLGVAENPQIQGSRLTASIRFGESPEAQQIFQDVQSGIIRNLSVGYRWLDYSESDTATTVSRWQPFEVSIVSVPADAGAGFYRTQAMPQDQNNTNNTADITKQERDRIAGIRNFAKIARVDETMVNDLIERGISLVDAKNTIVEKWGRQVDAETSRGDVSFSYGRGGSSEDIKSAMLDGLLMRSGITVDKPHPAARDFKNTSIIEISKILLRDRGDNFYNDSPSGILKRAMSNSDLPDLLSGLANKSMIAGFMEAQTTHGEWCSFREVSDFKLQNRLALSSFESLLHTPELSEVKYSFLNDLKESYKIETYQRAISFSRQMLLNDDLQSLTDMPFRMGAAATRKESDLVYSILTESHLMGDGFELFADTRGNHIDNVLAEPGLAAAVAILRKAKDIGGFGYLGLKPRWLIVGVDQELTALELLAKLNNPTANAVAIPGSDFAKISLIVEPRIESSTAWYLLAAGVETVEVGHLDVNGISFETDQSFNTDSLNMKVRLDCGAKALSPLGMVKSTGDKSEA
ncbi:MAG: HK97 family phage prohead protease [Methylococcaceae bacterium]